jgi:hypothetical protein
MGKAGSRRTGKWERGASALGGQMRILGPEKSRTPELDVLKGLYYWIKPTLIKTRIQRSKMLLEI